MKQYTEMMRMCEFTLRGLHKLLLHHFVEHMYATYDGECAKKRMDNKR